MSIVTTEADLGTANQGIVESENRGLTAPQFSQMQILISVTEETIARLEREHPFIPVAGVEDKAGLQTVYERRQLYKRARVQVEKERQQLKAESLEYGRKLDAHAKGLRERLEKSERLFETEEKRIAAEQAKIDKAKADALVANRKAALAEAVAEVHELALAAMTEQQFQATLTNAKAAKQKREWDAAQAAAAEVQRKRAEAEAAEKAKAEKTEQDRQVAEAQEQTRQMVIRRRARLAEVGLAEAGEEMAELTIAGLTDGQFEQEIQRRLAEREEAERQRLERARLEDERDELRRKNAAEQERLDAIRHEQEVRAQEQQAEADRLAAAQQKLDDEAAERKRLADIETARAATARREAEERLAREQAEREEQERQAEAARARELAMRPDREKLAEVANDVLRIKVPDDVSGNFAQARKDIYAELGRAAQRIRDIVAQVA